MTSKANSLILIAAAIANPYVGITAIIGVACIAIGGDNITNKYNMP